MSRQNDDRQLVPAYHHRGLLVGWRCSRCSQDFHLPLEQATDEMAPENIQAQFQEHSCAETLIEHFRSRSAS
jgi:uncharacterized metal-binding protein YceD (DUF177 family)